MLLFIDYTLDAYEYQNTTSTSFFGLITTFAHTKSAVQSQQQQVYTLSHSRLRFLHVTVSTNTRNSISADEAKEECLLRVHSVVAGRPLFVSNLIAHPAVCHSQSTASRALPRTNSPAKGQSSCFGTRPQVAIDPRHHALYSCSRKQTAANALDLSQHVSVQ